MLTKWFHILGMVSFCDIECYGFLKNENLWFLDRIMIKMLLFETCLSYMGPGFVDKMVSTLKHLDGIP